MKFSVRGPSLSRQSGVSEQDAPLGLPQFGFTQACKGFPFQRSCLEARVFRPKLSKYLFSGASSAGGRGSLQATLGPSRVRTPRPPAAHPGSCSRPWSRRARQPFFLTFSTVKNTLGERPCQSYVIQTRVLSKFCALAKWIEYLVRLAVQ